MNSLPSHKQLLIAESELNRLQLAGELACLKKAASSISGSAKSLASALSVVGIALTGWKTLTSNKSEPINAKPSTMSAALTVAELVLTLWMLFRTRAREEHTQNIAKSKTTV